MAIFNSYVSLPEGKGINGSMGDLQEPRTRTEVPIPYNFGRFFRPMFQGISPENMARNMVQYLYFRILKFPLNGDE